MRYFQERPVMPVVLVVNVSDSNVAHLFCLCKHVCYFIHELNTAHLLLVHKHVLNIVAESALVFQKLSITSLGT